MLAAIDVGRAQSAATPYQLEHASDGSLCCTTTYQGPLGRGTVFRFRPVTGP